MSPLITPPCISSSVLTHNVPSDYTELSHNVPSPTTPPIISTSHNALNSLQLYSSSNEIISLKVALRMKRNYQHARGLDSLLVYVRFIYVKEHVSRMAGQIRYNICTCFNPCICMQQETTFPRSCLTSSSSIQ